MKKDWKINFLDMILSLSDAIDMINPVLVNHHKQVAYIAESLAEELGYTQREKNEIMVAGLLHDSGALSFEERIDALNFEANNPHMHAESGYFLLKDFKYFNNISNIVRYHHVKWDYGNGKSFLGEKVPFESHIIHLADRVSVLINYE